MTDLRTYMSAEFFEDTRIIRELEAAVQEVAQTFNCTYDERKRSWPYGFRRGDLHLEAASSQSTRAMILCSILGMLDRWQKLSRERASTGMMYEHDFPLPKGLTASLRKEDDTGKSKIDKAVDGATSEWLKNVRRKKSYITESDTFGVDDPMLLGWALDLTRHSISSQGEARHAALRQALLRKSCERAAVLALQTTKRPNHDQSLASRIMSARDERRVGDSSYLLTRFAQILRSVATEPSLSAANLEQINRARQILLEHFETRLHEHLSFAEITDSRFDSTELAFCLEGMLLIRQDAVDKTVFDRVMTVLRHVQDKEGYWRSETPMLYHRKGDVLFTVSVEAVNAMLASFALFDGRWRVHDSVASAHIDLIKRYWRWLKARKASVRIGTDDLKGWHSEHVNDPDLIHLWETSQVAEFLVNFRDQLKRHVARKSLNLTACAYRTPAIPPGIKPRSGDEQSAATRWEAACRDLEPVRCLGQRYEVYREIGKNFVDPRRSPDGEPSYSMLLYGPPGTGKTTVASSLSWALGYPLITITVSDFLADGHPAIEARAKDLFDMLKAQPRSIVLFDEIDQFMLDRDSEYFHDQETVFQFLTPGMLTKLNDLRSSESVLFIMATNYAERIDAAIKRRGRIDHDFLLLPPDKARRTQFISQFWGDRKINSSAAAARSVFLGYSDIKYVAERWIEEKGVKRRLEGKDAVEALQEISPSATPEMYVRRFRDKKGEWVLDVRRVPSEEFFAMIGLQVDADGFARGTQAWSVYLTRNANELLKDFPNVRRETSRFIMTKSPLSSTGPNQLSGRRRKVAASSRRRR